MDKLELVFTVEADVDAVTEVFVDSARFFKVDPPLTSGSSFIPEVAESSKTSSTARATASKNWFMSAEEAPPLLVEVNCWHKS